MRQAPALHTGWVQIRIEGRDLPGSTCDPSPDMPGGYVGVHVGVQRRGRRDELLNVVRGDADMAGWVVECTPSVTDAGIDLRGPYVQGPPGERFIYLNWGTIDSAGQFNMFRRAKLLFSAIPPEVLAAAVASGMLVGRLGLTDPTGNPLCASVRPPRIDWSAEG
jgi:hypothetical protein